MNGVAMKRMLCCLAGLMLAASCGSDKVGVGGFCERDKDCREGLICLQNICTEPVANGCHPPCESFEVCIDGNCVPIDPSTDKDGDPRRLRIL